jgi:hypothetical protein
MEGSKCDRPAPERRQHRGAELMEQALMPHVGTGERVGYIRDGVWVQARGWQQRRHVAKPLQRLLQHRMRQHTSACVSIRQHASEYVSMRQHTSLLQQRRHVAKPLQRLLQYRIRQHTSAYVSIRQHTSAYVAEAAATPCHQAVAAPVPVYGALSY